MSKKIGVAIIGCGYWGMNYVRIFNELPDVEIKFACDLRESRVEEIRRRFPYTPVTNNPEEAIHSDEVDAVIVCTQASTHFDVAQACLNAGKHVLIEKPLTTTESDSRELIKLAEEKNLVLMVGHIFLFNSGLQKIRSYIEEGTIGRVHYLYARRTNLGPIREDVNVLWDLAPHDISIFNYLLNSQPEWVSTVAAAVLDNSRADVGFIVLGYPNNIIGHIHVSWVDPNKVREVVVVGTKERIVFDDTSTQMPVSIFEKGVEPSNVDEPSSYGEYKFLMRDGDIIIPRVPPSEPLKNQAVHFLDCILNNHDPITNGFSGLQVVRVMEGIIESMQHNGSPVELQKETI